jgi:CBS-domain-containing membrane protein
MKANLMRVNPKNVTVRDQSLRLLTAGVAGPALLWAGYKYPGTPVARAALVALGAALIYTNFGAFQATREPDVASE